MERRKVAAMRLRRLCAGDPLLGRAAERRSRSGGRISTPDSSAGNRRRSIQARRPRRGRARPAARADRPAGWLDLLAEYNLKGSRLPGSARPVASLDQRARRGTRRRRAGRDPAGALLGLWESGGFAGAQIARRAGHDGLPELLTDDAAAAAALLRPGVRLAADRDEYGSDGTRANTPDGARRRWPDWPPPPRQLVARGVPGGRREATSEAVPNWGGRVIAGPGEMGLGSYAESRPVGGAVRGARPGWPRRWS